MGEVRERISACTEQVKEYRRWLHAHPELSGKEVQTAAYIAQTLRDMGVEPTEGVGGHGVVALIQGRGPGKCVALRADFDALPVQESTGLPFASQTPGVMHACCHDTHAAMLLGAACVLNSMRDQFDGCVKLVFQPSEEDNVASGAKAMIADGVLENPKVDAMIGQHMWPNAEVGKVLVRNGPMMASSDRFYITVRGKKSHGSAPEDGVDAIVIAMEVISVLQTIVSRNISPLDSVVVTIGQINGGSRYNIIADEVVMIGTCRNLNPEIRNSMPKRIEKVIKGVVEGMGGSYEFKYLMCYSPTVNDKKMFSLVRDTVEDLYGEDHLVIPEHAALTGEDFSFFCERVPSVFFWLGGNDNEHPFHPLHSGDCNPSEDALPYGMEVMVESALRFLKQKD